MVYSGLMSTIVFPPAEQVTYGTYDLVEANSRHHQVDGSFSWEGGNEYALDIWSLGDPDWQADEHIRACAQQRWDNGRVLVEAGQEGEDAHDAVVPFEDFDEAIIQE